jgi:hypothetical protein
MERTMDEEEALVDRAFTAYFKTAARDCSAALN